jgi:hypothetical protein
VTAVAEYKFRFYAERELTPPTFDPDAVVAIAFWNKHNGGYSAVVRANSHRSDYGDGGVEYWVERDYATPDDIEKHQLGWVVGGGAGFITAI